MGLTLHEPDRTRRLHANLAYSGQTPSSILVYWKQRSHCKRHSQPSSSGPTDNVPRYTGHVEARLHAYFRPTPRRGGMLAAVGKRPMSRSLTVGERLRTADEPHFGCSSIPPSLLGEGITDRKKKREAFRPLAPQNRDLNRVQHITLLTSGSVPLMIAIRLPS